MDALNWPLIFGTSVIDTRVIAASGFGYVLGSIPFGLILGKISGFGDVRQQGSGNIGATNVLRLGNKKLAAGVLLADMLKGAGAVLIALNWGYAAAMSAGLAALLGHIFPIWLKFRGGKGVATYLGCLFAFSWPSALIFCASWLAIAGLSRISSLSALIAVIIVPIALLFSQERELAALYIVMGLIVFFTHRQNIARLLKGTEPKIGADRD